MSWQSVSRKLLVAGAICLMPACNEEAGDMLGLGKMLITDVSSDKQIQRVPAGERAFLRVEVDRKDESPVAFRWELEEGEIKVLSEREPVGIFYAPQQAGEILISIVASRGGKELTRKTFPMQIIQKEKAEVSATEEEPSSSSATRPEAEQTISITDPRENDSVSSSVITVKGQAHGLMSGENIVLVVRPIPTAEDQKWWTQSKPEISSDGSWESYPVRIGVPQEEPGTPFRICAVITQQEFSLADQLSARPPGIASCVNITR